MPDGKKKCFWLFASISLGGKSKGKLCVEGEKVHNYFFFSLDKQWKVLKVFHLIVE